MESELRLIIARYSAAVERQQKAMLGATMEAEIGGKLTGLEKEGRWRILRTISRVGEITFKQVANYIGDGTVKDKLIAKYLEEEQKAKAYGAMKVGPDDYEFAIRAKVTSKGRPRYIFDVKPKRDFPGAFKGEVHVDGPTGMPLLEAGQLEESPSVWLSKIKFSREYEMMDGVSVVKKFRSSVHVRLLGVGQAELNIDFSNVQLAPEEKVAASGF
jgi:hypothetical protein